MSRFLPVRTLHKTSERLSQISDHKILALRDTILRPHLDKLYYTIGDPYDIEIVINNSEKKVEFYDKMRDYLWWIEYKGVVNVLNNPIIMHTALYKTNNSGHALLLIYFPKENSIDMVSTYAMEVEEEDAIRNMLKPIYPPDGPLIRDVPCLIRAPMKLRNKRHCYNLQSGDTADIGWCAAWMMEFTRYLSEKSKEEFWDQSWSKRKEVYTEMYSSFVNVPDYNSMEVGKTIWNQLLEKYNEIKKSQLVSMQQSTKKRARTIKHSASRLNKTRRRILAHSLHLRGGSSIARTNRRTNLIQELQEYQTSRVLKVDEVRDLNRKIADLEALKREQNAANKPAIAQLDADIAALEKGRNFLEGSLKIYDNLIQSMRDEIARLNSGEPIVVHRRR